MTVGMALLAQLNVHTPTTATSLYMLVARARARHGDAGARARGAERGRLPNVLGVATSGSILFRQIGGSVGIAVFGAIFANRLHVNLANALPPGVHGPKTVAPATVNSLPPHVHSIYIHAFSASLHPVFLVGAVTAVLSFALTWFLREVPLRRTTEPATA